MEYLRDRLPKDIKEIGQLVRKNLIHKHVLQMGNTQSNEDLRYGDMTKVPWYRIGEDDVLTTSAAMLAELFRRDSHGLHINRKEESCLIITCRGTTLLVASILKSKGIPARVRSGFSPYFELEEMKGFAWDHWINQYWNNEQSRWITIDVDASIEPYIKFDPYDMPEKEFCFSADAWLKTRKGETEANYFHNGGGTEGLIVVAWELFYDFHSLMNNEPTYTNTPEITFFKVFPTLKEEQLKRIDD
ncbi:transglutaminase-like domain-containing protein, partial [Patescibacteria group bacterium]|nr:transglutaminase-like domain-containing protein [Patescibacteria group bacterium]